MHRKETFEPSLPRLKEPFQYPTPLYQSPGTTSSWYRMTIGRNFRDHNYSDNNSNGGSITTSTVVSTIAVAFFIMIIFRRAELERRLFGGGTAVVVGMDRVIMKEGNDEDLDDVNEDGEERDNDAVGNWNDDNELHCRQIIIPFVSLSIPIPTTMTLRKIYRKSLNRLFALLRLASYLLDTFTGGTISNMLPQQQQPLNRWGQAMTVVSGNNEIIGSIPQNGGRQGEAKDTISRRTTGSVAGMMAMGRMAVGAAGMPSLEVVSREIKYDDDDNSDTDDIDFSNNGEYYQHGARFDGNSIEPAFKRRENYPPGWLVYHPIKGLIPFEDEDRCCISPDVDLRKSI